MLPAMASTDLTLSLHRAIAEVPAADWDACAGGGNPFVSHAFLAALEESGSATARTGWLPQHAVLRDPGGRMLACAPCYAKSHSQGEYVFDYGWADAFERAGGQYYPKLQVCAPFSPVPGPRLLIHPEAGIGPAAMGQGLAQACEDLGISSAHVTFCEGAEWEAMGEAGWLQRLGTQFHWHNKGYASFEDFLGALSSRKRKAIRRERRDALANGISIEWITGSAITEAHWDAFFAFYMDTGSRKWGRPYLNRSFFSLIGERMADRVLLVMARREGRLIAGAINFIGGTRLYGRNWGCIEDHPFLHFEVCYYQAIAFAIARGLDRVEAGAQGEHKLARGYRPVITSSAHDIADPSLLRAVRSYLEQERRYVSEVVDELSSATPFKHRDED